MTDTSNPWLSGNDEPPPDIAETSEERVAPAAGPTRPQAGIPEPPVEDQLPIRQQPHDAPLFWVGAHGGAGESSLETLHPAWRATHHSWPQAPGGAPAHVVLVARTHMHGLEAAQAVVTQWASGLVPNIDLLGLVLIADAPGRIPKPLREFTQLVSGGVPRVWQIPWIERWRLGDSASLSESPRPVRQLIDELATLVSEGAYKGTKNRKENL